MSEFSCNTVRDMLPLYVDNIVSDDTRAIVEEHLTSCDACRKEYENMKNAFVLPADGDAKQLKRFKGAWKKKKRSLPPSRRKVKETIFSIPAAAWSSARPARNTVPRPNAPPPFR